MSIEMENDKMCEKLKTNLADKKNKGNWNKLRERPFHGSEDSTFLRWFYLNWSIDQFNLNQNSSRLF